MALRLKPSDLAKLPAHVQQQLGVEPAVKRERKAQVKAAPVLPASTWDGETLVVVLPLPSKALQPNRAIRLHWGARQKAKAKARQEAAVTAKEAMGASPAPGWIRATVEPTFYWKTQGCHDGDNALASLKGHYDGLVDAGILLDDAGLTHLPAVMDWDKDCPRVEMRIRRTI